MEVFKLGRIFKHGDTNVVIENGYEVKTGLIDRGKGAGLVVASWSRPADWRTRPHSWINKKGSSGCNGDEASYLSCIRNVSEWIDDDIIALATYDATAKDYQMLCDSLNKLGLHDDFAAYVREYCVPHGYQIPFSREDLEMFYNNMNREGVHTMLIVAFTMIRYGVPIFISNSREGLGRALLSCCVNKVFDPSIFNSFHSEFLPVVNPLLSDGHTYYCAGCAMYMSSLFDGAEYIDEHVIGLMGSMIEAFQSDKVAAMGSSNPCVNITLPFWEGRFRYDEHRKVVSKEPRIVR